MITFRIDFDLDSLETPLAEHADKVRRIVALDLWGALVRYTNIDTGRARAGWSIGFDGQENWKPGVVAVSEGWKSGGAPLFSRPSPPSFLKGAQSVTVYNNVEYIVPLNYGNSKYGGGHFVEKAIAEVRARIST